MIPIELAKKELEKDVLKYEDVLSIGVILFKGKKIIEVGVKNAKMKKYLLSLIPNNIWMDYPINIILRKQTKIQ